MNDRQAAIDKLRKIMVPDNCPRCGTPYTMRGPDVVDHCREVSKLRRRAEDLETQLREYQREAADLRVERDRAIDRALVDMEFGPDSMRPTLCLTSIRRIRSILGAQSAEATTAALHRVLDGYKVERSRVEADAIRGLLSAQGWNEPAFSDIERYADKVEAGEA